MNQKIAVNFELSISYEDEFEFDRFGKIERGDYYIDDEGEVDYSAFGSDKFSIILRKKQKWPKWIKSGSHVVITKDLSMSVHELTSLEIADLRMGMSPWFSPSSIWIGRLNEDGEWIARNLCLDLSDFMIPKFKYEPDPEFRGIHFWQVQH